MTPEQKLAELKKLDEQTLRTTVVIPLLSKMGYQDPLEYHHSGERGKDIVCKDKDDRFKKISFVAVIAKAGDITASASGNDSIFTILNQLKL